MAACLVAAKDADLFSCEAEVEVVCSFAPDFVTEVALALFYKGWPPDFDSSLDVDLA